MRFDSLTEGQRADLDILRRLRNEISYGDRHIEPWGMTRRFFKILFHLIGWVCAAILFGALCLGLQILAAAAFLGKYAIALKLIQSLYQ